MNAYVSRLIEAARTNQTTSARLRGAGILVPFLILFAVLSLTSGSFATQPNLLNILDQQSATLIIAAAGTLVLVAGGIDLSVGATYSLAGVTSGHFALNIEPGRGDPARHRRPASSSVWRTDSSRPPFASTH